MASREECLIEVRRDELYERVWTTPVTHLAREYRISDVGLAKLCARHGIPTPPRGYWASPWQGGRPPLEPARPGTSDVVTIRGAADRVEEKTVVPQVVVRASFAKPHPIVAEIAAGLKSATVGDDGRLTPGRGVPASIHVSKGELSRALRIMDALVNGILGRGHKVSIRDGHRHREVVAEVSGEAIPIWLVEGLRRREREALLAGKSDRERHPSIYDYLRYVLVPTGALALRMEHYAGHGLRKEWRDGRRQRLEKALGSFIVHLEAAAATIRREREVREAELRARRALEEERANRLRLAEEERARVQGLFDQAEMWHRIGRVREFVAAVRAVAVERHGLIEAGSELDRWLRWASDQVERRDPLAEMSARGSRRDSSL